MHNSTQAYSHPPLREAAATLPTPIASICGDLAFELGARRRNWIRCFRLALDLYEVSIAFLSFVQLRILERNREVRPQQSEEVLKRFASGAPLCVGHWQQLFRDLSADLRRLNGNGGPASRLGLSIAELYFDPKGAPSPLGRILDGVPGLRNEAFGHTWALPDDQYERIAEALLPDIANLLRRLAFLEAWTLFTPLGVERATATNGELADARFLTDVALLRGDLRRAERVMRLLPVEVAPGRVYLAPSAELEAGDLCEADLLDLAPFVVVPRDGDGPGRLFLWQSGGEAPGYATPVGGERRTIGSAASEIGAFFADIQPAGSTSSFEPLHQAITAATDDALASWVGRSSYHSPVYLVRPRLVGSVERFLAGSDRTAENASPTAATPFVVAAPSGMGKTALFCHIAERHRMEKRLDRATWLVFAQDLGESRFDDYCRRRLGTSAHELQQAASGSGTTVEILVDGIDRHRKPAALFDELAALFGSSSSIRLGVSITDRRLAVLQGAGVLGDAEHWPTIEVPPLGDSEARVLYSMVGGSGERTGGGARELTSPLLIKMAARGGGLAVVRTVGRVLQAWSDTAIFSDVARAELTGSIVDQMIACQRQSLSLAEMRTDPALRAILLAEPARGPLSGLLEDGVLYLQHLRSEDGMPLPPQIRIGFTVDLLLEYLLFARLAADASSPGSLSAKCASMAGFLPLAGALRLLVLEWLGRSRSEEAVQAFDCAPASIQEALLTDLFVALAFSRDDAGIEGFFRDLHAAADDSRRQSIWNAAGAALARLIRRDQFDDAHHLGAFARTLLDAGPSPRAAIDVMVLWARKVVHSNVNVGLAAEILRECLGRLDNDESRESRVQVLCALYGALQVARQVDAAAAVVRELNALDETVLSIGAKAMLLLTRAIIDSRLHRSKAASSLAAEARTLAREAGDKEIESHAANLLLSLALKKFNPSGQIDFIEPFAREALSIAEESGDSSLVAEACSLRAWSFDKTDHATEMVWIERGLERAAAAENRTILLYRRASHHVKGGRMADAIRDGIESARLAAMLGRTYSSYKTDLHITALCAWETGNVGDALRIWRKLTMDLIAIREYGEAALSSLLIASTMFDAGLLEKGRSELSRSREFDALRGSERGGRSLNYSMAEGQELWLAGDPTEAMVNLQKAARWGEDAEYPDFVFQPRLLAARILIGMATDQSAATPSEPSIASVPSLASARTILLDLLEKRSPSPEHRERYLGEILTLLAHCAWRSEALEEGRTWIAKAGEWFAARGEDRTRIEYQATEVALDELELRLTTSDAASVRKKLRARIEGRIANQIRPALDHAAGTFDDAEEGRAWCEHHPAEQLLRRLSPVRE